jgi:hypothetical protein
MGNCAGYCNGAGDADDQNQHQIKNAFNQKDMVVRDNDFESKYGKLIVVNGRREECQGCC